MKAFYRFGIYVKHATIVKVTKKYITATVENANGEPVVKKFDRAWYGEEVTPKGTYGGQIIIYASKEKGNRSEQDKALF